MDKRDFLGIMQKIKYAYGDRFQGLTGEMLVTWYECLGALDAERLGNAAIAYIKNNRYPPTIAELRAGYENQKKPGGDLAAIYEEAASCYPGGHSDRSAKNIYAEKLNRLPKVRRENAARKIAEAVKRYVACQESADGIYGILPFGEFLREIEISEEDE